LVTIVANFHVRSLKEKKEDLLFEAAWKGDLETFREILPHFRKTIHLLENKRNQSVLFCACRAGRVPIVAELLQLKCMTKKEISRRQGPKGCTPLHAAGWGDFPEIVALLLIQGADMEICNDGNQVPEREAGLRSSVVFDKFKIGGEILIQDYAPVAVRRKKKKKLSNIMGLSSSGKIPKDSAVTATTTTNATTTKLSTSHHHALPKTINPTTTILPSEWFSHITGQNEPEFRRMKTKPFTKNSEGGLDITNVRTKQVTHCGKLKVVPITEFSKSLAHKNNESQVMFEIITREDNDPKSIQYVDVAYYQSLDFDKKEERVLFQVASNFNGIEAICDDLSPDMPSFTEQYIYDRTQGPIASISAGGAAIARVHAAFYEESQSPDGWCQTTERQINILKDLKEYFPTQNGYVVLSGNEPPIPAAEEEQQKLFNKFHVCYHENVQVTTGHRTPQSLELINRSQPPIIDQVFCAAINIHQGESGKFNKAVPDYGERCQFVLNSIYSSTYISAIAHKRTHLFLTLIGGGAFGNHRQWIYSAILESHLKYARDAHSSLKKVTLILFRRGELEDGFLDKLEKNNVPHQLVVYNDQLGTTRKLWPDSNK